MASTRQLKTRIRSVKSTKQITKAMQLVAASKMRRAQEAQRASGPYTHAASEILTFLASQGDTKDHPLFQKRDQIKSRLLIVIATDKGLAGAYDANVLKLYTRQLLDDDCVMLSGDAGDGPGRFASTIRPMASRTVVIERAAVLAIRLQLQCVLQLVGLSRVSRRYSEQGHQAQPHGHKAPVRRG